VEPVTIAKRTIAEERGNGVTGWVLDTVLRRGRSQWAVFVVVAVVCLITATLLATLAVQVSAAERFGVPAELGRSSPDSTAVDVDLTLDGKPLAAAETALAAGTRKLFGGLPYTSERQLLSQGALVPDPAVRGANRIGSMVHYGSFDGIQDRVRLVSGRWPAAVTRPDQPVETVVPERLLADFRITLGARFRSTDVNGSHITQAVVVGTFRPVRPLEERYWLLDPTHGAGLDPQAVIPYTIGETTNGYSPLLVDRSAFEAGAVSTDLISVRQHPDLTKLGTADVDALATRVAEAGDLLSDATASTVRRAEVFTTLGDALDRVRRFRLMTEVAVIVIGSLLLERACRVRGGDETDLR
jgi:hypothetical protein